MTTVSRYTPGASPAGLSWRRSRAGVVPDVGVTSSHAPFAAARALHASGPDPVFERVRLSRCIATLPAAALSSTRPGAMASAAVGGGVLVSLSSLQVTQTTVSAHAAAPSTERPARGLLRDLWVPCDERTSIVRGPIAAAAKPVPHPVAKRRRAGVV